MRTYTVRYKQSTQKELERLPAKIVERIRAAIRDLADDPRPHGSIKLKDYENTYRIRVGSYRVVYEIYDDVVVVLIVQIAHRKDVYR